MEARSLQLCLLLFTIIAGTMAASATDGDAVQPGSSTVSSTTATAATPTAKIIDNKVVFCDDRGQEIGIPIKEQIIPWSPAEKQSVLEVLNQAERIAPFLLLRATAYSPTIRLYRCSDFATHQAATIPVFVNSKFGGLIFYDGFFHNSKDIQVFGKVYPNQLWTVIHELTHLADAGGKLSGSKEWTKILRSFLAGQSQMWQSTSDYKKSELGIPSGYTAKDPREALAELTTAVILTGESNVKPEVAEYIARNLLSPNFVPDRSIEKCYEGQLIVRERSASTAKLNEALSCFEQALELDPTYLDAEWGKKAVLMRLHKE